MLKLKQFVLKRVKTQDGDIYFADVVKIKQAIISQSHPAKAGETRSKLSPGGPIPHNLAKTFDGPPTLERSGSEHRVGRFPPSLLRREGRGERWSPL